MQKIILLEDGIKDYIRHCARERKLSENTLKSYRIVLNAYSDQRAEAAAGSIEPGGDEPDSESRLQFPRA